MLEASFGGGGGGGGGAAAADSLSHDVAELAKGEDVFDPLAATELHHKPIDPHPPPARRRHPPLHELYVAVVRHETLVIVVQQAVGRLLLELGVLFEGVVLLLVGVHVLPTVDIHLEAAADAVAVRLGERRHHLRNVVDEGRRARVRAQGLEIELGQLVDKPRRGTV